MANLPDIPGIPRSLDRELQSLLGSMREHLREVRGLGGDKARRALTAAEGAGGGSGGGTIVVPGPGGGGTTPDYTPPPMPSGGGVVAGIDFIAYQTDPPTFSQGNGYARTKVYGAKWPDSQPVGPTFANAVLLDEFVGQVGSTPTDPATRWCIWLKWVTKDGIESSTPAGGTNGFMATTGQDVTRLLLALAGKLKNEQLDPASNFRFKANLFTIENTGGAPAINPFTVVTTPTLTPAGELLPVGVYMEATYIKNLEAALGRFQQAFITNAMIVSVSASRITSGVISVGNYIQSSNYVPSVSGWRIQGDGTAEFGAASIRGKLTANQIDGKGLEIRDSVGNMILGAGNVLAPGYLPDEGRSNLVDLSWWRRGGPIPWTQNGEVNILYSTGDVASVGPRGGSDIVWYAREAAGDGQAGGGWDAPNTLALDPTKVYRFVVPIRKRDGASGYAYWGPQQNTVCSLNTTNLEPNPYFNEINRDDLAPDRWHLFVGYVFPYGSIGNSHAGAGIFDCKTGSLVAAGSSFCHAATGGRGHRAYQYYAGPGSTQLFGRPMVNLVDGTEPPLREFFEAGAVLNGSMSLAGANGTISLNGGGGGSATGIVMPGNPITAGNVSTYIASAAIGAAQVGSLTVGVVSNAVNGGVTTGARIAMNTNELVFYNSSNVQRIRMVP